MCECQSRIMGLSFLLGHLQSRGFFGQTSNRIYFGGRPLHDRVDIATVGATGLEASPHFPAQALFGEPIRLFGPRPAQRQLANQSRRAWANPHPLQQCAREALGLTIVKELSLVSRDSPMGERTALVRNQPLQSARHRASKSQPNRWCRAGYLKTGSRHALATANDGARARAGDERSSSLVVVR